MGNGYWNTTAYTNAASARRKAGVDDFGYTSVMRGVPRGQRKPAPSLDAYRATVREARDSDEHPNSTPIAVLFDVTGSMLNVPQTLQRRLPDLLGLLTRGGYAQDPQILVGAIGDDVFDAVPLQIGQFESDNRSTSSCATSTWRAGAAAIARRATRSPRGSSPPGRSSTAWPSGPARATASSSATRRTRTC